MNKIEVYNLWIIAEAVSYGKVEKMELGVYMTVLHV
jgi:hypothetical protein